MCVYVCLCVKFVRERERERVCNTTILYILLVSPADYEAAGEIDCDASLDVDEGWVLSGIHRHFFPNMCIVTASLPSNGDYSSYIKSGMCSAQCNFRRTIDNF